MALVDKCETPYQEYTKHEAPPTPLKAAEPFYPQVKFWLEKQMTIELFKTYHRARIIVCGILHEFRLGE